MSKTIVLGAGIVGLSCAYYLIQAGKTVAIVDPSPEGDKASFGNAAGFAVTECIPAGVPGLLFKLPKLLLDPLGPLFLKPTHVPAMYPWLLEFQRSSSKRRVLEIAPALAALNDRTYKDFAPILRDLEYERHVHNKGCLVLYNDRSSFEKDRFSWDLKAKHGVKFEQLNAHEVRELEPDIGPRKQFGVLQTDWSHISSPKQLMDRFLNWVKDQGTEIIRETAVALEHSERDVSVRLGNGEALTADDVVVATGAWSKSLANSIGDKCLLESERGYNTTFKTPGISLSRELLFAEEMFAVTPINEGLRVGGAAEFAGLKAPPNYERSRALAKLASRMLPKLQTDTGDQWMGHRSATPDSLPVIGSSPKVRGVHYAFGHGHLGLTQGPATGRLIADLVLRREPIVDVRPYGIERFT
ncbi:D-amino-acid dehydrogenase [Pseudovibrio denitrificans]|uniref:D-amino-acid dehydrogenase n=1 Tax=Pseudovibrio denitrificans TaxID=258256 RepID=A0A1I7DSH0_9HYPH|nr:FAD-binding oxidoreductase [Pseudovibrio denitrificans]SFU14605.1 D-amino-acid dehydrogenase [Pseudovibrio denitrificans]